MWFSLLGLPRLIQVLPSHFPVSLPDLVTVTHNGKEKDLQSSATVTLLASSPSSVLSLYHSNCMHLRNMHKSGQKGKEGKCSSWAHSWADASNHLHSHPFRKSILSTYHVLEARDTTVNKRDIPYSRETDTVAREGRQWNSERHQGGNREWIDYDHDRIWNALDSDTPSHWSRIIL